MSARKYLSRVLLFGLAAAWCVLPGGQAASAGCFSIVVGKNASADGSVIIAHNEDDTAPQLVNHRKVARRRYRPGEQVTLRNGGRLPQVEQTWAYLWSEMPGMLFSDSYVNEHGVSITSDNCPSREDKPEITDGGIGYMLRRLVAERATSAREAVLLAGRLVERFGYIDSGRTYIICDREQGWLFCVVNGKHWVARRVPDEHVAMVANTYTIRRVDLADEDNFLGSADLIDYAAKRGWYDPRTDGAFDFAAAYANPAAASSPSNIGRRLAALGYVSKAPPADASDLPFSVLPDEKLGPAELMKILRHDNQSKTALHSSAPQSLCQDDCAICRGATQTSFVAQLRPDRPADIGVVYWLCLAAPAESFYIPFHFGITDFPPDFRGPSRRPSQQEYESAIASAFCAERAGAFWTFSSFCHNVRNAPPDIAARVRAEAARIERAAFEAQEQFENAATAVYATDRTRTARILAAYSNRIYEAALEAMEGILECK